MKHDVDDETLSRIGAAFLICAQYPEIFGDVPMEKFRAMFIDDTKEDEDND